MSTCSGGSSLVTIKSIEVARRGSNFLINGSDRFLRVYDLENLKKELSNDEEEEEVGGRKEEKGEGERGKGGKEIEVDPLLNDFKIMLIECNGRNVLYFLR